jgi:hypothetical protein
MRKTIKLEAGLVLQFPAGEYSAIIEDGTLYLPAVTSELVATSSDTAPKEPKSREAVKEQVVTTAVKAAKQTALEFEESADEEEFSLEKLQEMSLTDLKQVAKDYDINVEDLAKKNNVQRWSSKTLATALYEVLLEALQEDVEYEEEEEEEEPKPKAKKEAAKPSAEVKAVKAVNVSEIVQEYWDGDIDEDDAYLALVKAYGKDKIEQLDEWFETEYKSANASLKALENMMASDEEESEEDSEEDLTPIAKAEWSKLKPGTLVSIQWHSQDDDWFDGEVIAHDDERAEDCDVRIRKTDVLIAYEDGTVTVLDSEDNEVALL